MVSPSREASDDDKLSLHKGKLLVQRDTVWCKGKLSDARANDLVQG